MEPIPLHTLVPGQKGRITAVNKGNAINKRIADMGMVKGSIVAVQRIALLGDPISVRVKGYHLSLRKQEASNILVELI